MSNLSVSRKEMVVSRNHSSSSEDLSVNDNVFQRTHLGHILHPGTLSNGEFFMLTGTNYNNPPQFERRGSQMHMRQQFPDVMLVKKFLYTSRKSEEIVIGA